MDRSLDEIIAEDTQNTGRPSGGSGGPRRHNNPGRRHERDGVRKPYTSDRVDLNLDWVHDKFDDDRSRPSRGGRRGRDGPDIDRSSTLTKVRVENLHYDITETDLEVGFNCPILNTHARAPLTNFFAEQDLFGRIGPVSELTVSYDRAGRSEGVAYITYARLKDAHTSIQEYDGANAKGQPIRLSLIPGRRERNPLDSAQRPRHSLLDRVERPRDDRSMSPENNADGRRRRGGGRAHRSDVTKPAPDNIDRYVPGQRSHQRSPNRRGGGRRGGRDNRSQQTDGSNRRSNARPRKTQEELDQEMEDYWGGANNAGGEATAPAQDAAPQQTAPAPSAPAADDDIDMIE
ncbi:RNA binding protein, putative [Penicillium digitatum PHI26]|uniref:RNA binding protein, putative n=2 Tax=Penicillium digitatum TaxID=36651 RepID=K9FZG9_PEND2|nr:RNA binding protein, putative [Penicillium digitatum Pd1]EKV12610.1 RNA binding protein, putative [Penicillium digitatum Pd1]EKV14524.1 RNA binding protein, putative [Penicillium digitatum PHI26]